MIDESKRKRPAMPGAGRPLGALNKFTRDLKTALLDAAVLSDYAKDPDDEDAPGTLTEYCLTMVHKFPELYFQALMRLVPKEINTHLQQDTTIGIAFRSIDEVKTEMINSGFSHKQISTIEAMMPVIEPVNIEQKKPEDDEDILFDKVDHDPPPCDEYAVTT